MTTAFQKALKVIERQQDFLEKGDEEDVKEYVIKPLLLNIGWNIFDREELKKEYQLPNGEKIDYSLRLDSKSRVFVEAKRWKPTLTNDNRDQLHRYCLAALKNKQMVSNGDVPCLGILTNGRFWRFYVAPDKTNHKLRQMDPEIDIISADKARVHDYFTKFLNPTKVRSDESKRKTLTIARKHHKKFVESIAIRNKLTRAWNSLIDSPKRQENLLAHFASSQKIQAERELIGDFINSSESLFNPVTLIPKATIAHPRPTSFTLRANGVEETIPIEKWAHLNLKLCEFLYARHAETFAGKMLPISTY